MRLFVSSFVVALATLVGAALVPASAASTDVGVTTTNTEAAPLVQKATYWGHRRGYRHYGWRGRHYGWRGYGWRGRHYGWRHRGYRRGWHGRRHW